MTLSKASQLIALAERCDRAMSSAITQHFNLEHGLARTAALRDAADYATVAAALRAHALLDKEPQE